MKEVHATSHKESTHKKTKCVAQGDAINWPRQARKKRARHEPDGKNPAVFDTVARTHQYHAAERTEKGRGRQLVEHLFCAAGTVDVEGTAGG